MRSCKLGEAGGFEYADQRQTAAPGQHNAYGGNDQEQSGQHRASAHQVVSSATRMIISALSVTKITYRARVLVSPNRVARVRLPTCASPRCRAGCWLPRSRTPRRRPISR